MHSPNATAIDTLDSGQQLARAVAQGQVRAIDLCESAIDRIERLDGPINAVVVRDFDRARQQARDADAARARGERGALLGVPMTVKESFDIAGLPTTWGLPQARGHVATEDAVAVRRLKQAGAVILGKTNVAAGLADWQCDNPVYGRTVHPLDASRTPGGSSGGSAAALASGMVALELGSDIGGSIRVPAHFCGVFGHKPSHGLLSTRGHGFPGHVGAPNVLSVIGPMTRRAEDLGLLMDVLAGPDLPDAIAWHVALPAARHRRISGHRVFVLTDSPSAPVSADVRQAVRAVAGAMADAGCRVEDRSALLPDLEAATQAYGQVLYTLISRAMPGDVESISAHAWLKLLDERARLQRQWQRFFESFDVLLAPPLGVAACTHEAEPDWHARRFGIDGVDSPWLAQSLWTGLATFPGLPATVAPAGRTATGLPIGIQIIGPSLEDRTPLAVAQWLDESRAGAHNVDA